MAKKKVNKKEEYGDIQFSKVIGTPTILLLPARNYKFKVFEKDFSITIPRYGEYMAISPELFSEEDGEFYFLQHSDEYEADILYLPALSKLLFATGQYPDLQDGQAFTPIAFIVREDEVEIIGNLIEMIKEN